MAEEAQAVAQNYGPGAGYGGADWALVLKAMMETQRSIGQLAESVNGLKEIVKAQNETLKEHSATLKENSTILSRHDEMLSHFGEMLRQHGEMLKEHGKMLSNINRVIFAAGAVTAVLAGIGAFVLDKIWDSLAILLQAAG